MNSNRLNFFDSGLSSTSALLLLMERAEEDVDMEKEPLVVVAGMNALMLVTFICKIQKRNAVVEGFMITITVGVLLF